MNPWLLKFGLIFGASLLLAACSNGEPKFDKKNPPTGGTRAELAYQMASRMADQGYCGSSMPVFVCLATQGTGWEVAAQRAGTCAPIAAKLWQEDLLDAAHKPTTIPEEKHRITGYAMEQPFAYQSSAEEILAEGLRQLRRAANANWPAAQAELATQLYAAGGNSLPEAQIWLQRYDNNVRRKIYGGDEMSPAIRKAIKEFSLPPQDNHEAWSPVAFASEAITNHDCNRLLGIHTKKHPSTLSVVEEDDGIERTKPNSKPTQTPSSGETHGGH